MASKAQPDLLSRRLPSLLAIAFGRHAACEPLLPLYGCIALQRLADADKAGIGEDHAVFQVLERVVAGAVVGAGAGAGAGVGAPGQVASAPSYPLAVVEQAIRAVYVLHPNPQRWCGVVLKRMARQVFGSEGEQGSAAGDEAMMVEGEGGEKGPDGMQVDSESASDQADATASAAASAAAAAGSSAGSSRAGVLSGPQVSQLAALVFAVGQTSLEHVVLVDSLVRRVRKAAALRERAEADAKAERSARGEDEDEESEGGSSKGRKGGKKVRRGSKEEGKESGGGEESGIAAEVGTAVPLETRLEIAAEQAEREIVSVQAEGRRHLVGQFGGMIGALCRNWKRLVQVRAGGGGEKEREKGYDRGRKGVCKRWVS